MCPEDYRMVQADFDNIQKIGLINHLNQGGKLPTLECISELQNRWKRFAENPDVVRNKKSIFMGKKGYYL